MLDKLIINKAIPEDAEALLTYMNLVGSETDNLSYGSEGMPMTVEQECIFIERMSEAENQVLLVGKINNEIVCVGSIDTANRVRLAHLANLAITVRKNFWGKGFGNAMMEALVDFCKSTGVHEQIKLTVMSNNERAISLYKKHGFEEYGYMKNYMKVGNVYHDAVFMILYL